MASNRDSVVTHPGVSVIYQKIRGSEVGLHSHEDHEFFFPIQGEIQVLDHEKKIMKAGPGKMVYLPPNTQHSFLSDAVSQGERIILLVSQILWKKHSGVISTPRVMSASQLCKEIVFQLLINPKTKALSALIQTLIETLSEMIETSNENSEKEISFFVSKTNDQRLKKALYLISENFTATLSSAHIAKASGLSVRNLNRLFLNEFGMTPKQIQTALRIQEAKKELSAGKTNVTDTALSIGYSSVSQFIAIFRQHTGQIPSAFLPKSSL